MQPPKTKVSVSEEREGMGREVNETRKMKNDRNDELELLLLLPMFELWSSFSLDSKIEIQRECLMDVFITTINLPETSKLV